MDTKVEPPTLPIYQAFMEKLLREDSESGRAARSAVASKGLGAVMNPVWVSLRWDYGIDPVR